MHSRWLRQGLMIVALIMVLAMLSGCLNMGPTPTPVPSPTPGNGGGNGEPVESPNAVNFTLPNIDGGTVSLRDYRGKPVWLVFFRPGCPACTKQAPTVQRLYNQYRNSHGLVVLGIGVATSDAQLRQVRTTYGWTFPVLSDFDRTVYRQFFTGRVPANVFINRLGEEQNKALGNKEEAVFEQYLNQIL